MAAKMKRGNRHGFVKVLTMGLVTGLLIILGGALLAAYLVLEERISPSGTGHMMIVVLFLAAFIGDLVTIKMTEKKIPVGAMLFAGAFFLLMLIIDMLFFNGVSSSVWGRAVAVLFGTICSVAICLSGGKKRAYKKMRSR